MNHFVLVDCNNFYVSCERLFNPQLEGLPVIVLSNNDGCVIARSEEAKQLNIKMGDPFFKIRDFCKYRNVAVYSSNYQLYGDLSSRVMNLLSDWSDNIQVYSIDEAFLTFPQEMSTAELNKQCAEMRRQIKRYVGIPTSFGLAPTKTLAKVANKLAKKNPLGIVDLSEQAIHQSILEQFPVKDVWGVGKSSEAILKTLEIETAWEFRQMEPSFARKKLGVIGERMVWELAGRSCLPLEQATERKTISCSRSFGKSVTEFSDLAEALSTYVNLGCLKMRKQKCCLEAICIYLERSLDSQTAGNEPGHVIITFAQATNHTAEVISRAKQGLKRLFCKGQRYKKCGVVLLQLVPDTHLLPDLFLGVHDQKKQLLMKTVDALNAHFGKNTLIYGAMGTRATWKMRSDKRSPLYTTSWQGLAIAKA